MADFITGSWCLGQFNILNYCNREFSTVDAMNKAIINNTNAIVGGADRLIFTGDFCFGPLDNNLFLNQIVRFRNQLNCRNILFIIGNHDSRVSKLTEFRRLFSWVGNYLEFVDEAGNSFIINHYPLRSWNRQTNGSINIYSHDHGKNNHLDIKNQIDCSIDNAYLKAGEYRPLTTQEIVGFISS